jgi:6-phosphogluconolactonase
MTTRPHIRIFATPAQLFEAAAAEFGESANRSVRERGRFTVALSGGSTPRGLFQKLAETAKDSLPWKQIFFFWSDERHVPPDHADSNFKMAYDALLSKVPVPEENIFRVRGEEEDAAVAAQDYEQKLREFFRLSPGEVPRFDLILLGMGPDGHTASLFPGSAALGETSRLVVSNWVEKFKTDRVTMTYPVLNHAANIWFLVTGKDKAEALREVLEGQSKELPSSRVEPFSGNLVWMVDAAAASALSESTKSH